ncbi:MAG: nucleotidyltransferase domain-containing protein [Planctomycetaceae bacterium]|nr:nucleotidyltransferase domain-containing protein [Planctomycetaceae bacterium]
MGYEDIIDKVEEYSKRVVERYSPITIVLYGSYAKGTATEDSDIDIAVICDSLGGDYLERAAELFRLRRDIDLRIEPVLIEADDGFCREILRTGKVVYAKSA